MSEANAFEPKIVAYVCNWCTYLGADLAGTTRLEYPANVRIIRLPCTGRIDFNLLIKAFEIGADAVLVNTAIAIADDPVRMAQAFKLGVAAGEAARLAGAADASFSARASSPLTGFLRERSS